MQKSFCYNGNILIAVFIKGGERMPGEKEINCSLFDKLDMLERIERVAKATNAEAVLEEIEFERKQVERKLYQQPPLTSNEK